MKYLYSTLPQVKESRQFKLERERVFLKGKFDISEDKETNMTGKGDTAKSDLSLRRIFLVFFIIFILSCVKICMT